MIKLIALSAVALSLVACGGGSSESEAPNNATPPTVSAKPGGFYIGRIHSDGLQRDLNVSGIILENGTGVLWSEDGMYTGNFLPSGTDVETSFVATTWEGTWDGSRARMTGTMSGVITERDSFDGTYKLGGDSGTIKMTYTPDLYEVPSSPAAIDGTWGFTNSNGYALSVQINEAGQLFGSDTAGCVLNGEVEIVDEAFNAYEVPSFSVNCGSAGIDGWGVAYVSPFLPELVFLAIEFDVETAVTWALYRQ